MSTNHILALNSVVTYLVWENKPAVTIFITQPAWHSRTFDLAPDLNVCVSVGWVGGVGVWGEGYPLKPGCELSPTFERCQYKYCFELFWIHQHGGICPYADNLSWLNIRQTGRQAFDCCQISLQSTCPATTAAVLSYYWSNISVLLSWTCASRFASLTWL